MRLAVALPARRAFPDPSLLVLFFFLFFSFLIFKFPAFLLSSSEKHPQIEILLF